MNRFCIVLTVLFSINLTTSDFVSADDRAHRNGIKSHREAMQKLQEQKRRSTATDNLFKQAIKSLEASLKGIKSPGPKAVVHLYLGISKYEYRRGSKKEAAESLKSALENDWLDTEQRADAHLYLALSLLALGEKAVQENFKQAFRQNPNIDFPSWRRDDTEAVKEFNKVQKAVTGTLTITLSPPEAKNWTIWINEKKLDRINRAAVIAGDDLRLYKGKYTVKGIYKNGRFMEEILDKITIMPNRKSEISLQIPSPTLEHEPPSSENAGKEIELTFRASRKKPNQVNIYYRKVSERKFTPKRPDNPPMYSSEGWTYKVNLPPQNFVGKIEYYIQATYEDPSTEIRNPENRYDYHQVFIVDNTPPTNGESEMERPKIISTDGSPKNKSSEVRQLEIIDESDNTPPTNGESEMERPKITSTDGSPKNKSSEVRQLEIIDESDDTPPTNSESEVERPKIISTKDFIDKRLEQSSHQEIWPNFVLSNDFFKDGPSAFDWGRGSLLGIAYLREGKNCWTFGGQVDFPDWTNKVSNPILTGQLGYFFEKFGLALLGRGRISDNSTYSLGGSLKLYPGDRVTIDFTGSINLRSVRDARTNGASISDLLDTKHLDRYEVGIRFPIYRRFNMRVGFGGWHLGRNTTGVQVGLGYTF